MAVDLKNLRETARLMEEQRRIIAEATTDWVREAREVAEPVRDIVDPPYLRQLREQHEMLKELTEPGYLQELRETHERIRDIVAPSQFKELAEAFAGTTTLGAPGLFGEGVAKQLAAWTDLKSGDHFAWLRALMPTETFGAAIAKSLRVEGTEVGALVRSTALWGAIDIPDYAQEFRQLSALSTAAESILGTVDLSRGLADLLGVHDVTRSLVEYETGRLNLAYAGFSASVARRPEWLAAAPEFVRTAPGDSIFTQAYAVRVLTTHTDVEDTDQSAVVEIWTGVQERTLGYIEAVLPELSPKLMKSWEGVWDAARRRGPDWARHAASSLRYILIDVLDRVAPVDQLRDVPREYYRAGKNHAAWPNPLAVCAAEQSHVSSRCSGRSRIGHFDYRRDVGGRPSRRLHRD